MEYATKTIRGLYKLIDDIDEADAIVMSTDEYDALMAKHKNQLREMKKKLEDEREELHSTLVSFSQMSEENDRTARQVTNDMKEKLDRLTEENTRLSQEKSLVQLRLENQIQLNQGLKRIAKERSCADRDIPDKKNSSGYLVLRTGQTMEKTDEGEYQVWKTNIQTPYDASLPFEAIHEDIHRELQETVLGPMGVDWIQTEERNGIYETLETASGKVGCGVYRVRYSANLRSGYWELELYHNCPIFVPAAMRPPVIQGNKQSPKGKGGEKNDD